MKFHHKHDTCKGAFLLLTSWNEATWKGSENRCAPWEFFAWVLEMAERGWVKYNKFLSLKYVLRNGWGDHKRANASTSQVNPLYCYVLISLTSSEYCKHAKHYSYVSTDTSVMCCICNLRHLQEKNIHNLSFKGQNDSQYSVLCCTSDTQCFLVAWKDSSACCQIQITVPVVRWGKLDPEKWLEGHGPSWHR